MMLKRQRLKYLPHQVREYPNIDLTQQFTHSAMVDKGYMVVGGHVEESILNKIVNGEYVHFARLLPRDRIIAADNDENRMELVFREW